MTGDGRSLQPDRFDARITRYVSVALAAVAVLTSGLGLAAVPISGANCPKDCIGYPYLDTLHRFPRDYLWIYVALVLVVLYLMFMVSLRVVTTRNGIPAQLSVAFAVVATVVLGTTYFTQAAVVPASLAAEETAGITMLTMYNPHGLFIAMEETGYLSMSLSFLFAALAVTGDDALVRAVRWVFAAGFVLPALALVAITVAYGLDRQDRFEVVVLSVDWLVLIANGILVAIAHPALETGVNLDTAGEADS